MRIGWFAREYEFTCQDCGAEAMEAYRLCARCGVDKFTQRPVRGS